MSKTIEQASSKRALLLQTEDDFLEWDDDDPWEVRRKLKMINKEWGRKWHFKRRNEGDTRICLVAIAAECNTNAVKDLAMGENASTIEHIAETITDAVHAINLARSGLNDFKDVRTDGGYEPLISRLIAMFYRDVEPLQ